MDIPGTTVRPPEKLIYEQLNVGTTNLCDLLLVRRGQEVVVHVSDASHVLRTLREERKLHRAEVQIAEFHRERISLWNSSSAEEQSVAVRNRRADGVLPDKSEHLCARDFLKRPH